MRASVTVRVAGSTSNLGAGFDCGGVAVGRWLRGTARVAPAAPGVFGGANLVLRDPDGLVVTALPMHPSLALVFAVPEFTVETKRARAALPAMLPHADAARAAAKSAALVHGLAHADLRLLAT